MGVTKCSETLGVVCDWMHWTLVTVFMSY